MATTLLRQYLVPTSLNGLGAIGTSPDQDFVNSPSSGWFVMQPWWEPLDLLREGTLALRSRASIYLPQMSAEDDDPYKARVARSVLFPFYAATIRNLVSKPFQRSVNIPDENKSSVAETYSKDMDRAGTDLTTFLRDAFDTFLNRGVVHVLTDVPQLPRRKTPRSIAEEKRLGFRPFAMIIRPENVIAWRHARDPQSGAQVLVHLRIYELTQEEYGNYGLIWVERIREYNRSLPKLNRQGRLVPGSVTWALHEHTGTDRNSGWSTVGEGTITLPKIPLVTLQATSECPMVSQPPLLELGVMNLSHWEAYSDYRNVLHAASIPVLWGAGWSRTDVENPEDPGKVALQYGPFRVWLATSPDAKLNFVEHNGSAIGASHEHLKDLEAKMADQALRPFIEPVPRRTGTEAAIIAGAQTSEMQDWVKGLERFGVDILDDMAMWTNATPGAAIDIFSDFGAAAVDVLELANARNRGDISQRTYWKELVRRGYLAETFDPDMEEKALAKETQAIRAITETLGGPQPTTTKQAALTPPKVTPAIAPAGGGA